MGQCFADLGSFLYLFIVHFHVAGRLQYNCVRWQVSGAYLYMTVTLIVRLQAQYGRRRVTCIVPYVNVVKTNGCAFFATTERAVDEQCFGGIHR